MHGEDVRDWIVRLGNTEHPSLPVTKENKKLRLGSARGFKSNLSSVRNVEGRRFRYMEVQVGKKIAWLTHGRTERQGALGSYSANKNFKMFRYKMPASLIDCEDGVITFLRSFCKHIPDCVAVLAPRVRSTTTKR
jgi:hypothetical protein